MTVRRISEFTLALGLAAMASGCASDFGGPISNSSSTALSPQERRLQEVETKTAQLVRRLDSMNQAQADQDMSRMRDEIRSLRGDIEKLRFDFDNRDRASKDLFASFDRRLAQVEAGGGGGAAVSSAGGSGTVAMNSPGTLAPTSTPKATVATPEEERAYLGTFDQLKNGKYDEAIKGFRGMLDQWPQGRYADNGWYWMGEAQMVKKDFTGAANSFQSLVSGFPSSPKVADGLYKLGLAQVELKKPVDAKAALQRAIREYPNTNAANLAKQKLDQLGN